LQKHANSIEKLNEELQNQAKGILNHRDTLRDCKSTMEKTSKALFEYKNKTDNQVLSLQESIDNIEKRLRKNDTNSKQVEILAESVDSMQRKLMKNDLTSQKLENLHERTAAIESSQQLHANKINALLAKNETQVQFQVLGPRRK